MKDCRTLSGMDIFKDGIPIYLNINSVSLKDDQFMHNHDFLEIAYVSAGTGYHIVGDEEYSVSKGYMCIINYNVPHKFVISLAGADSEMIIYNCVFKPEFIDYTMINDDDFKRIAGSLIYNSIFVENKAAINVVFSGNYQVEIESLYRKMQVEFFTTPTGYVNILRSCLIEMLTKIFRYMETDKIIPGSIYSHKSKIINKAFEFLKDNYNSADLDINEVALRAFLSKSYFSKLFKDVTGQNFSKYLQNLRITEACSQLKNTSKKISDIMMDVGFKDMKHFSMLFKQITGKTPGEYRKCI